MAMEIADLIRWGGNIMRPDQLYQARNPLLPAAMIAIQPAAQRARQVVRNTHTAIVAARAGRIERIVLDKMIETTTKEGLNK